MSDSLLVSLTSCNDPALVGGKAAGLGWLLRNGFPVPPGVCVTTAAYHATLRIAGLDPARQWAEVHRASQDARGPLLDEWRRRVAALTLPRPLQETLHLELTELGLGPAALWAVRSSASAEDKEEATFAGVYRTALGVSQEAIPAAIIECWASLWTIAAFSYHQRAGQGTVVPAMAVVIQPLLSPRAAGVAYSCHPVTGQRDQVVINAVFGLAEPLVSGRMIPDEYTVEVRTQPESKTLLQQEIAQKPSARLVTPSGLTDHPLPEEDQRKPVLAGHEAIELAALAKRVEQRLGRPVDIEWALDGSAAWLLQARAIPDSGAGARLTERTCVWSRANFKETLPELPSQLALSFVQEFMETNIVRHYREIGCRIPPGLSSVRVIQGRPYINVTLFQSVTAQLGGDPTLIAEQMGGDALPVPAGVTRLAWWRLARAAVLLEWKIWSAVWLAPARFAEMKRLGMAQTDHSLENLSETGLLNRSESLHRRARERDLTFAIVSGVSQALFVLGATLERRLPGRWRPLLNAATRGLGGIISANQILQLAELAELARREPVARAFLLAERWEPEGFRARLAGTRWLQALDEFLAEYGHRAFGESDIMSPRFAETPAYVLGIIRGHLQAPAARSVADIRFEQQAARQAALTSIRKAFGWRLHEWAWFWLWYQALSRYLELREGSRHHLMHFLTGLRRLVLILGQRLVARGVLHSGEDLFFLSPDEVTAAVAGSTRDWNTLVTARREARARNAQQTAPDTVPSSTIPRAKTEPDTEWDVPLKGIPISAGFVEGPVRLMLSPGDAAKVKNGDILVVPVIDPGMAPLFGLAAGLIVEMGGTLSHGAIIAREYGIPAIANIPRVTRLLRDGERVAVDASLGVITRLNSDTVSR